MSVTVGDNGREHAYQATDAYLARLFRCKDGVADSAVELTLERLRLLSMSRRR